RPRSVARQAVACAHGPDGQRADRGGAPAGLAGVDERSAVLGEGGARSDDAQAGAVFAGGEERSAEAIEDLRRHAPPGVAHGDAGGALGLELDLDLDISALRRRLDCVTD